MVPSFLKEIGRSFQLRAGQKAFSVNYRHLDIGWLLGETFPLHRRLVKRKVNLLCGKWTFMCPACQLLGLEALKARWWSTIPEQIIIIWLGWQELHIFSLAFWWGLQAKNTLWTFCVSKWKILLWQHFRLSTATFWFSTVLLSINARPREKAHLE